MTCRTRQPGGAWTRTDAADRDVVVVPCPATTLPLDVVYEGVDVPAAPRSGAEGAGGG